LLSVKREKCLVIMLMSFVHQDIRYGQLDCTS
jgi:hypothetical protein